MNESVQEPRLYRPRGVVGAQLRFRDAQTSDAEFILSLRLDPRKNRYLSATSANLADQKAWLERYASDTGQVYFIIETLDGVPIGTVRLYDVQGDLFSWGSWMLSDEAPKSSAVESTLMVYGFGRHCGFRGAHFEVRKGNEKVWQYHERLGAVRTREDDENFYYEIDEPAIDKIFERYRSRLPGGVVIE